MKLRIFKGGPLKSRGAEATASFASSDIHHCALLSHSCCLTTFLVRNDKKVEKYCFRLF